MSKKTVKPVPGLKVISSNNGKKKSAAAGSAPRGKNKTVETKKPPRIELTRMTMLELDGLEYLKKYTGEKTSSGAIKFMLCTIENLIKLRDELQIKLMQRESELIRIVVAHKLSQEHKENLLQQIQKVYSVTPSRSLYPSGLDRSFDYDDPEDTDDDDM